MARVERVLRGGAKKNELEAELTFWYGINAFELTDDQKLGLMANLSRVQAQQLIHLGKFDNTDPKAVYDLFADAFNADAAERAKAASARQLVRMKTEEARLARRRP